jgi:hypothetical protein
MEDIQKQVEKLEGFLGWFAAVVRTRNRLRALLLAVVFILILNPLAIPAILAVIHVAVPGWYAIVWLASIAVVFCSAVLEALKSQEAVQPPPPDRSAIKGLRPFVFEDKDIFSRLQRHVILRECLTSITSSTFHFGVLSGDSGSGKSSFLQAGLWPALSNKNYRCVYVRFSDIEPNRAH